MPAFLQSFIEAEQERSRRIEQLRKEIREFAKEEAGSSITEQILLFLADEMVEHLSEIDYELRMKFELYITPLIKRNYIYRYTGTFDRIRQAYIRERMKTPAGQRECEWKYKNEILFVPYHSDPVIVKSVETVRCRSNMVWNFKAAASEKLKRQIFTVLEYILENYEISRLREYKLTGLQLFYEFCIREQITDIQLLELEQETAFQDYLKQKVEKEQRRKRLKSIVETARKVIFIETDETRWDATIWYLERFRIAKERINQSDSIEKISFQEVLQPKNRLLLQEYMKYEIGIGELALSTVYERFRTIRNFLQEISELEVTKCDASLIDVYLKNLQNGAMGAKTFNTNVSGIQFFMKFLEVKGYIKKVPFYASYYLEKQIPVHHNRSVEEDVYMEIIQNLSQFPEHLRMMFLHLWCVGLRISEVCTLKGDAYYIQNGDCWMKVYQVKMKNYKRVPIPVTLYRLMQVYLKKHPTEKEAYIFRNRKGGAFSKSTFMGQMKKYCSQIGIYIYGSGSKGEMFRYQEEKDAALLRYSLRKDGFAYLATESTGDICTKALRFYGEKLYLNVCAPYGVIKVRILNEDGKEMEGMSYEECTYKCIDLIEWTPVWISNKTVNSLKGQVVFLEIEITNGELYAIRGDFDVLGANYIKLE